MAAIVPVLRAGVNGAISLALMALVFRTFTVLVMTLPSGPNQTVWGGPTPNRTGSMMARNGPASGTQSVAILECPLLGGPGSARRDHGASSDAGAEALEGCFDVVAAGVAICVNLE